VLFTFAEEVTVVVMEASFTVAVVVEPPDVVVYWTVYADGFLNESHP
jgi:hypothetical protein